jgi:hypothetical protein
MRMWMLAAGAAALAITAPALADPKGDRGGGRAKAEQSQRGGQSKAQTRAGRGGDRRGGEVRLASRGGDRERGRERAKSGQVRTERAKPKRVEAQERRAARVEKAPQRVERADRQAERIGRDDRRSDRAFVRAADRDALRRADDQIVIKTRDGDRRVFARTRVFDDDDGRIVRRAFDFDPFPGRGRGLIAGCPPGLDKKDNGCMPPGHVKNLLGVPLARTAFANSLLPFSQRSFFRDDDDFLFRAGNGFIYRVDRDNGLIDGLIPLATSGFGSYYALGDPWPSPYNFYNVPYQYRSMYYDNYDDDDCYRYDGFGAIYRTDCNNGLVTAIAALLAGDLGVGSQLPLGYNTYNVPLAYRSTYYDTPTAWYRYNDGYIYRVDPTTRLITAVIDALV